MISLKSTIIYPDGWHRLGFWLQSLVSGKLGFWLQSLANLGILIHHSWSAIIKKMPLSGFATDQWKSPGKERNAASTVVLLSSNSKNRGARLVPFTITCLLSIGYDGCETCRLSGHGWLLPCLHNLTLHCKTILVSPGRIMYFSHLWRKRHI